ncbi:MAG: helix-turn-helix domain-containing protein [Clostridiales bacterium]|jgi:two-component system response regulator YesN|nr:helix-turn-helix domain-containing protein [Clostridiales bacterium]
MSVTAMIQSLRQLHHACRVQAALYSGNELTYALPQQRQSASLILSGSDPLNDLSPPDGLWTSAQPLQNQMGEQYLYYALSQTGALLLGPWLSQPMEELQLQRLARLLTQDEGRQQLLLQHYRVLPVLEQESVFFLGKLMVRLFEGQGQQEEDSFPDVRRLYQLNVVQNRMALFEHPPLFLEQELTRAIRMGDKRRALQALAEINRLSRATVAKDPLRSLKNSLIGSCALCSRAAIAGGVEAGQAFTLADTFIQTLEEMWDPKALAALEEHMVNRFTEQVADLQQQRLSGIVRSAVHYIEEHLSDKLSVKDIARQVYVHPDYLSARFKKETGENLGHYIRRLRVEEAERLLRFSTNSLAQIAEYCQFSSQSAFTKVFRQLKGMTPRQYREAAARSTGR